MERTVIHPLEPFHPPSTTLFNLRAGAIHDRNNVLLLAGLQRLEDEDTAHTVVLKWQGGEPWLGTLVSWSSASVCRVSQPAEGFVLVGVDGDFAATQGAGLHGGRAVDGALTGVNTIGEVAYAVGTRGKVLRFDGGHGWTQLPFAELRSEVLHAAAGYSPNEVYVVGTRGTIGLITTHSVQRLDSPTNLILTSVCCAPDESVYACGQKGIVLRGRRDRWRLIEHDATDEDLWGILAFQGRVFVSSMRFLYELKGDSLERVRFAEETPTSFGKLAADGDTTLMSIGQKDVALYDGREWTRLI